MTILCAGAAALVHEPRAAGSALQGIPGGAPAGAPAGAAGAPRAGGLLAAGHTTAAAVTEEGGIWIAGEVASVETLFCSSEVRAR